MPPLAFALRTFVALTVILASALVRSSAADTWPDGGVKVMPANGSVWTLPGSPGQIRVIAQSPLCTPALAVGYAAGVLDTSGHVLQGNGTESLLFCHQESFANLSLGPPLTDSNGNVYSLLTSSGSGCAYKVLGSSLPSSGVSVGDSPSCLMTGLVPRDPGSVFAIWASSATSTINVQAVGPSGAIGSTVQTVVGHPDRTRCGTNGRGLTMVAWTMDEFVVHYYDTWCELRAFDASGNPAWPSDSLELGGGVVFIEPDSAGGVYVGGFVTPHNGYYYVVHRRDVNGNVPAGWSPYGVVITPQSFNGPYPYASKADGLGGLLYVLKSGAGYEVHRLLPTGVIVPGWNSVFPADAVGFQIAPDGFGGAVVAWSANNSVTGLDAYVQHIFADGSLASPTRIPLAVAAGAQEVTSIRSDLAGHVYVCWSDTRDGTQQAYVGRLSVRPFNSRLAFTPAWNPSLVGRPVTLTAAVRPAATGSVDFFDGGAPIGTVAVVDSVATLAYVPPAVGVRTLTARYSGDALYEADRDSIALSVVERIPTVVVLTTPQNPITGRLATLTASVAPDDPTGTFTFALPGGGTATVPVAGGTASITVHAPVFGTFILTASYSGDVLHFPSSSVLQVTFEGRPTSTTLAASADTIHIGDHVTLSSTVQPDSATGSVTFFDDGVALATRPLDHGHASLDWSVGGASTGHLTASYSGDTTYATSTGSVGLITPQQATSTMVEASSVEAYAGTLLRFTIYVSPPPTNGTVEFSIDGNPVAGALPATGGVVQTDPDSLPVGAHYVQARFLGSPFSAPSSSDYLDVNVLPLPAGPYLRVFTPNNGEHWPIGYPRTIKWNASGTPATVSLYLSRNSGSTWNPIALDIPNTGSYTWTVTGPAAADAAMVWVTDPSYTALEDMSDVPFSIGPGLVAVPEASPDVMFATAYPNPSSGPTSVRFALPHAARVKLSVIDLLGREVAVLADGDFAAGRYSAAWDGRGRSGAAPAGVYFVRMSADGKEIVARVAVLAGR